MQVDLYCPVWVKICGVKSLDIALLAQDKGADAVGFVFHPFSPRFVSLEAASAIISELKSGIEKVALVTDASFEFLSRLPEVGFSMIQFHGNQPADFCQKSPLPWMRAVQVPPDWSEHHVQESVELWKSKGASKVLLDAWHPDLLGGTGEAFDWALIPESVRGDIVLAGGLSQGNVADAIRMTTPYGIDVSGGVESSKGVKSASKIEAFIQSAKRAL